jgi:hypothetical protein
MQPFFKVIDLKSDPMDTFVEDALSCENTTIVLPLAKHSHTIIFLHAHGDYGGDIAASFVR